MIKILAFPAYKNKDSNPYNYLLYSGIEKQGVDVKEFSFKRSLSLNYDLIHIHWPELYLNSHYLLKAYLYTFMFIFCLMFSKVFGKKIIWTAHNLKAHNVRYPKLSKVFWAAYLPLVDGVISLSKANEKLFFGKFNFKQKIQSTVIHHGLYASYYQNSVTKQAAKKYFSIDESKKVCLFIGQVKAYKNVEALVKLFDEEKALNNVVLIIAGKFESKAYFNQVNLQAAANKNIIIHDKFIFDNDLQYYFNAAEICLLPFKDIFNSGSVLLAASYKTPVIAPYCENFIEYADLIGMYSISTYANEISAGFIVNKLAGPDVKFTAVSDDLSWSNLQEKLSRYYRNVLVPQ
jgi:glycosyltransferase involved in cell wall biosynthesis